MNRGSFLPIVLLVLTAFGVNASMDHDILNLSFENGRTGSLPAHWLSGRWDSVAGRVLSPREYGSFVSLDRRIYHSGRYSLHLSGQPGTAISSSNIVGDVKGKTITFSGWIKTKRLHGERSSDNVWAGFWMRVDTSTGWSAFNNMCDSGVRGTHDWTRYSFNLPVSARATNVNFGILKEGVGDLWVDDLEIDTNGTLYAH